MRGSGDTVHLTIMATIISMFLFPPHITADNNDIDGFWSRFATPYENAIRILANDALKPLADAKVPTQPAEAERLLSNSKIQFQRFYTTLEPMRAASEELKQQQDQRIIRKTLERQQLENAMNETDRQIAAAAADLSQQTSALHDAQVKLGNERASLHHAHINLQSQQQNLDRAQNCIWKSKRSLHKRNIFKEIGKGFQNIAREIGIGARNVGNELQRGAQNVAKETRNIVNVPCKIGGAVDGARDAVRRAEENVRHQEQRVAQQQAVVNAAQNTVNQRQQTKAQQQQKKQSLEREISDMRTKLHALVEINTKVKQIVLYLSGLFDAGHSLSNTMEKMINTAELLDPLQYITDKIVSFGGRDTAALRAAMGSLRQSMVTLHAKLPEYPLPGKLISN
ncbi:uncharacterized protein LOC129596619 [Paramacrobiotus metropolitanus]|uniref:uncharacterized protein LOC129596619 n=1 Tax=Paramacrobiotus metropolitanus TaxID=2943436 RepID=UPI0024459478|nr:uncharacterized protein LOC129596619 [Paramacrobiotus metropolitanus]